MKRLLPLLLVLAALPALGQPAEAPNPANLTIAVETLGDSEQGVVVRTIFRFAIPSDVPSGVPLILQGSISQDGKVVKRFRYPLQPSQRESVTAIQTLAAGEAEIDARLMIPLEESAPVIFGKTTKKVALAAAGRPYVASESDGAEAILAEGVVPESVGSVKILTPRRDVSPNLFIVDVAVKPPATRVEFWVDSKKILVRNAPPYRAELDLGTVPKRVEVRAVGYDAKGRYIDADAFIVNERETPLEVKITRTETPDGVSHFKLSIQNPKNTDIRSVSLFAGKKKLFDWSHPPYAIDIPTARLAGTDFVRASVVDSTNYEASDILFLAGGRYSEQIDVNVVELPVSVTDSTGAPINGLTQGDFQVLENGKPQPISSFHFASDLALSLGVLIDHSGSMSKRMETTRKAAVDFFRSTLRPGDRAFVAGFSFEPSKTAPFVTTVALLEEQIGAVPEAEGGTSLHDAIVTGLYRFRSMTGRKALIVLTDGADTTSRLGYEEMLAYTRAARVPLYFIGVGLSVFEVASNGRMKALAAETGGTTYMIRDVKELPGTYAQLEKDLRSQYVLTYRTETSKKDLAYRTVEVKVNRPDASVRTIRGYVP